MSKKSWAVFGLREESRPEGEGYLYVSYATKTDGLPLAYFNLYKTSGEQFKQLLLAVLPKIFRDNDILGIELLNFRDFAAEVFREVASKYTSVDITIVESEALKLHL